MKIYVKDTLITFQERDPVGEIEARLHTLLFVFKDSIISINVTLSDGEGNTHELMVMR